MPNIIPIEKIENKILLIRGQKVMLDRDLALLYQVPTFRINEQVKRNIKRFPANFMFQLNKEEFNILKSHFAISSWGGTRKLPNVFTEQGIAMLSGILKSEKAIEVNIAIMRTFVKIRQFITTYEGLAKKISEIENKYDKKITEIFKLIDILSDNRKSKNIKEIGFKCK